ncbi:hypothetical protein COTS27_01025 [Spirochaetota bacterium]|nr:hypothetical protein COTS27_01025 [Spirochaetota bacterium]
MKQSVNDLKIVKKKECYLYCRFEATASNSIGTRKVSGRLRKYYDLAAGMNGHRLGVGNRFMQSKFKKYVGRRYESPRYRAYSNGRDGRVLAAAKGNNESGINADALRLSQYVKHHLRGLFVRNRLLDEYYLPMLVHPGVYEKFIMAVGRSAAVIELLSGLERFDSGEEMTGGSEHTLKNEHKNEHKNECTEQQEEKKKEQSNYFILSDLLLYFYLGREEGYNSLKLDSKVAERTVVVLEHGFPEISFLEKFKPDLIVTGTQGAFGMGGYRLVFYKRYDFAAVTKSGTMRAEDMGKQSLSVALARFLLGRTYTSPGVGLFCGLEHPVWCGMSLWLYKEGLEYYYKKKKKLADDKRGHSQLKTQLKSQLKSQLKTQLKAALHKIKRLERDADRRTGSEWLKIAWIAAEAGEIFAWITIKSRVLAKSLSADNVLKRGGVVTEVRSLERVVWVKKDVWRCFTKCGSILCLRTREGDLTQMRLAATGDCLAEHHLSRHHAAIETGQNDVPIYTLVLSIPIIVEENHLKKPLAELILWMEELKAAMTDQRSSVA